MAEQKKGWFIQNLANLITVLGLISSLWLFIIGVSYPDMLWLVLVLGIVAGLSDFLDGKIARRLNIRTPFGVTMDRIRDKIFVCLTLGLLAWQYRPNNGNRILSTLTETLVVLIIILEILIFSTHVYGLYKKNNVSAGQNGKIKMFGEFFAIAFWLISLNIDKYFSLNSFSYIAYLVASVLIASFFFGAKGFAIYCQKYSQPQRPKEQL